MHAAKEKTPVYNTEKTLSKIDRYHGHVSTFFFFFLYLFECEHLTLDFYSLILFISVSFYSQDM